MFDGASPPPPRDIEWLRLIETVARTAASAMEAQVTQSNVNHAQDVIRRLFDAPHLTPDAMPPHPDSRGERGNLYPSEEHTQPQDPGADPDAVVDEDTVVPPGPKFDPHDLPLDSYPDCEEKDRQIRDPKRRQILRDDPIAWITAAAYYCQNLGALCDSIPDDMECVSDAKKENLRDIVASLTMMPGSAAKRRAKVQEADGGMIWNKDRHEAPHAAEYDTFFAECYVEVYRARHEPHDLMDDVDYSACLLALGEPCLGQTWREINRTLESRYLLPGMKPPGAESTADVADEAPVEEEVA